MTHLTIGLSAVTSPGLKTSYNTSFCFPACFAVQCLQKCVQLTMMPVKIIIIIVLDTEKIHKDGMRLPPWLD